LKPAACALLALLGGCASAQWTNDRGETATRDVLSECTQRSMARASAEDLASGTYVSAPSGMGARTGRIEFPRSQVPPSNTGIQEQRFFNLCMKEKGYDLVAPR